MIYLDTHTYKESLINISYFYHTITERVFKMPSRNYNQLRTEINIDSFKGTFKKIKGLIHIMTILLENLIILGLSPLWNYSWNVSTLIYYSNFMFDMNL